MPRVRTRRRGGDVHEDLGGLAIPGALDQIADAGLAGVARRERGRIGQHREHRGSPTALAHTVHTPIAQRLHQLGDLATGDQTSARNIQQTLANGISDSDLLPKIDDLPEFLNTSQFEQRFEHVGSPAYEAVIKDIMARIGALPLYGMQ